MSGNEFNGGGAVSRRPIIGGTEGKVIKTDFLHRMKYNNSLPDIPYDAKFVACPLVSLSRFVDYKPTNLEREFKFELLAEPDLNVKIDLINPGVYATESDGRKSHHPVDLELLEDELANTQNIKRSQQHSKVVPWMRKTEYISSEFTRFGTSAERQETKIGYSTKKKFQNEILYRDRDSQIEAIGKTFDDADKPVSKHPSKKDVVAVEELPLLPDEENWMHPFALVVFDGDPIPQSEGSGCKGLMSHALIRGMMDEEGEQFVTYFLPTRDTISKRDQDDATGIKFDSDFVYEYRSVRDYNWLVRNKSTKGYEQDIFLLSMRDGYALYNELETKVSLTRRKTKKVKHETKLHVRHRSYDEAEIAAQNERLASLLRPYDEQDDNEEGSVENEEGDENEEQDEETKGVDDETADHYSVRSSESENKNSHPDDELENYEDQQIEKESDIQSDGSE